MAQPVKRGDTWSVRIELPADPITGERKRARVTAKSKAELKRKVTETEHRVMTRSYVPTSRQAYGDFLTGWLENVQKREVRDTTYAGYVYLAEGHIKPTLGRTPLQDLTASQLEAFYTEKLTTKVRGDGTMAPQTVRLMHSLIRRSLAYALRHELVSKNVASIAHPPKKAAAEIHPWNREQQRAFLKVAMLDETYPSIWPVALGTGMRRGELLGPRWQDVDLEAGTIKVAQQLVKTTDNRMIYQTPKTEAGKRSISLSPHLLEVLRRQSIKQKEWQLASSDWAATGLVFTTKDGQPIHPTNLGKRFAVLCGLAKVPAIRFHDLRHTHATELLRQGIDSKHVAQRLGHSSITVTLDVYSHVMPDMQWAAIAGLDDALFGT